MEGTKNNKDDIKKAIELSETFCKEVIPISSYLNTLHAQIKDKEIFRRIAVDADNGKEFDFDLDELESYKIDVDSSPLFTGISNISVETFSNVRPLLLNTSLKDMLTYNNSIIGTDAKKNKIIFQNEFEETMGRLLNTLEYFSMYFNTEVASEKTVYQSLHQVFRSVILTLYIDICRLNKTAVDKYYTNIIQLFNKWNREYFNSLSNEVKAAKDADAKIAQAKASRKEVEREILKIPSSYK